ncbi:hypothetical protein Avbf_12314 [Armadillidium vulgare]|nr:hypothetical protein Avbf_12314 [Armadillidium vulgare]
MNFKSDIISSLAHARGIKLQSSPPEVKEESAFEARFDREIMVEAKIVYATSNDPNYPPTAVLDGCFCCFVSCSKNYTGRRTDFKTLKYQQIHFEDR